MKKIIVAFFIGMIVTIGGFIAFNRLLTDEDTWLCQNEQWVKHGNPSAPMPLEKCGVEEGTVASSLSSKGSLTSKSAQQSLSSPSTPESGTSAGTAVKTFTATDFTITYPDWSPLPPASILEPDRTKVGVRNAGCGFIVTMRQLPEGDQFKPFIEKLIADQVKASNVTIITKEIGDTTMHVEGEFPVGDRWASTSQYGYITRTGQLYSIVFASEKSAFQTACAPFIKATIASVKAK